MGFEIMVRKAPGSGLLSQQETYPGNPTNRPEFWPVFARQPGRPSLALSGRQFLSSPQDPNRRASGAVK